MAALLLALPARADPTSDLAKGLVTQGVQMLAFAGCFLALDDDQTCIEVATRARDQAIAAITQPAATTPSRIAARKAALDVEGAKTTAANVTAHAPAAAGS